MQTLVSILEKYGLFAVFLNVLLEGAALPLPSYPILMVASALAIGSGQSIIAIFVVGLMATMLADFGWFLGGRRYGPRLLGLLCRISLSPDSCTRRTQSLFTRFGPVSLSFAKFIPGVSCMTVVLAGGTNLPLSTFLVFDAVGGIFYIGAGIVLGALFNNAIDDILGLLSRLGHIGIVLIAVALTSFIIWKWWQRQRFMRQLRMNRITVDGLLALLDGDTKPIILDVRFREVRARDGFIPGSIGASPQELDAVTATFDRDAEFVVYCACPNEASAVLAIKHLKKAGFKKMHPLLGGIDAWIDAGQRIERPMALAA